MISWFPYEWTLPFYLIKGMVALVASLLLIWHMTTVWPTLRRSNKFLGRRLRYYSLLWLTLLITYASAEQYYQAQEQYLPVAYRNLGGFLATILIIAATLVALHEHDKEP